MLENFTELNQELPSDKIIKQIQTLISSGQLKSGDRLPSERKLAEKLGVGRTIVKDAIRKLEIYGILRTLPQSGTIVAGMGLSALEGLISDVLKLEKSDLTSLVETRVVLETHAAKMAARRRTDKDIEEIKKALLAYESKINNNENAGEEDLKFHLAIAEASKNAVLKSLMLVITPDILKSYIKYKVYDVEQTDHKALKAHQQILEAII